MKPDLAATLDAEKSGITADELTVGASRKVWWRCPDFPDDHDGWEAVVGTAREASASAMALAARTAAWSKRPRRSCA
ncbi:zinc-ribbon domain-containing protein [Streptomyces sp. CA-288835]|uniref:zinc-ribbon domain-containing protein n=1 Tax=Streptomyces sp. CA-288835 TaxID=3240069 RepID=UPI003D8E0972